MIQFNFRTARFPASTAYKIQSNFTITERSLLHDRHTHNVSLPLSNGEIVKKRCVRPEN